MSKTIFIHPTAEVDHDARIGAGTKLWNLVQVRERAVIGENCIIGKSSYIDNCVIIGNRVKIQNMVSIFYGVTIEDDVFVGPSVTFTNDKIPRAFNTEWRVVPTLVKKGASIGANSTIVCGVTIGEYGMVAAGSVVTRDVEPFSLVMGNPARHVSYIDKLGNRIDHRPAAGEFE